jgi:hypothetical protein
MTGARRAPPASQGATSAAASPVGKNETDAVEPCFVNRSALRQSGDQLAVVGISEQDFAGMLRQYLVRLE